MMVRTFYKLVVLLAMDVTLVIAVSWTIAICHTRGRAEHSGKRIGNEEFGLRCARRSDLLTDQMQIDGVFDKWPSLDPATPSPVARWRQYLEQSASEVSIPEWALPFVIPRSSYVRYDQWLINANGWPCRALASVGVRRRRGDGTREVVIDHWYDGVLLSQVFPGWYRALPMRPIWKGIVINALVYVGPLALSMWLFGVGKRKWRLWRMRCPLCRYDLRGGSVAAGCPECGWNRPDGEGTVEQDG